MNVFKNLAFGLKLRKLPAGEIRDRPRRAVFGEIARRGHHDRPAWRGHAHGDHVLRDHFAQPDAGIETFCHDVRQLVVGDDLDGQAGMTPRHLGKDRGHAQLERDARRIDAQQTGNVALRRTDPLCRGVDFPEGPGCRRNEDIAGLGKRDAARRARKQRCAEPNLGGADGMADRRGADAELGGRPGEVPGPGHGQDGGKLSKQKTIH